MSAVLVNILHTFLIHIELMTAFVWLAIFFGTSDGKKIFNCRQSKGILVLSIFPATLTIDIYRNIYIGERIFLNFQTKQNLSHQQ